MSVIAIKNEGPNQTEYWEDIDTHERTARVFKDNILQETRPVTKEEDEMLGPVFKIKE